MSWAGPPGLGGEPLPCVLLLPVPSAACACLLLCCCCCCWDACLPSCLLCCACAGLASSQSAHLPTTTTTLSPLHRSWRIPFLLAFVTALLGYYLRAGLPEPKASAGLPPPCAAAPEVARSAAGARLPAQQQHL